MKTRYTALVSVKKSIRQKSERVVQNANQNLQNAQEALATSFQELSDIQTPQTGNIQEFLSARTLLDAQRDLIRHNEEWVAFAQKELSEAKEQLKHDSIEYEKFHYLELEEIKKVLQERKYKEAKELDEVALMTYEMKQKKLQSPFGEAS